MNLALLFLFSMSTRYHARGALVINHSTSLLPYNMDGYHLDQLRKHLVATIDAIDKMRPPVEPMPQLLSQVLMAKALGISDSWFNRLVRLGKLPAPTHIRGKRKLYVQEDIATLQKAMDAYPRRSTWQTKYKAAGWINMIEAAKILDMPEITFKKRVWRNFYPKATHQQGRNKYYTREEVEAIRNIKSPSEGHLSYSRTLGKLGLTITRFAKLVATGAFPSPKQIRRYDYYTIDQVDAMRAYLESL